MPWQAPGVQSVGVATKVPLDAAGRSDTALFVRDHPLPPGTIPNIHQAMYVSPGYFAALGIPIVDGQSFAPVDATEARSEVVVSRALANRYWPDAKPIGKLVRRFRSVPWYTIVGVAGDVRGSGLDQPADETIYLPLVYRRWRRRGALDAARRRVRRARRSERGRGATRGSACGACARTVARRVRAHEMRDLISSAEARTAMTLSLLGLASAISLVLGAVGIYGVVSYAVALRTREIAVRIALGADPVRIRRSVSPQAMVTAAIGVVVGLAGALGVTRALAALLVGVSPIDPPTLRRAAALLLAVALAASWIPARRASAVDPAQALRTE